MMLETNKYYLLLNILLQQQLCVFTLAGCSVLDVLCDLFVAVMELYLHACCVC